MVYQIAERGHTVEGTNIDLKILTLPLCVVKLIECFIQIVTSLARRPRMFVTSPIEGIILLTMEPASRVPYTRLCIAAYPTLAV